MREGWLITLGTAPMIVGFVFLLLVRPVTSSDARMRSDGAAPGSLDAVLSPSAGATRTYTGVIVAGYAADVGAEFGGTVAEVLVQNGHSVKLGEPLLRIDQSGAAGAVVIAQAQVGQQQSQLARAQAELNEAQDGLRRLEQIQGGVSEGALVTARARVQTAQANLTGGEAAVRVANAELGQHKLRSQKQIIRAPFSGRLVERFVDPGNVVGPGQVVARVITDQLFVRFALPPHDALGKLVGTAVRVKLAGAPGSMSATVTDLQPEVEPASQLLFARAKLDDEEQARVMAGARVDVVMPIVVGSAP